MALSEQAQLNWDNFKAAGNNRYVQMGSQMVGTVASAFPTPRSDLNSNNEMSAGVRAGLAAGLQSMGGWAAVGGAALTLADKTGIFADASDGLGKGLDTANMIGSILLPGSKFLVGDTNTYKQSAAMQSMGASYASTLDNARNAEQNAGASLLFGKGKANNMINQARMQDKMISDIKGQADQDYQATASMTQSKAMSAQNAYSGGYNQSLARAGRQGMKLTRAKRILILSAKPEVKESSIESHKEGGALIEKYVMKSPEEFFNKIFSFNNISEFKDGGEITLPQGLIIDEKTGWYTVKDKKSRKDWEKSEDGKNFLSENGLLKYRDSNGRVYYLSKEDYDKLFEEAGGSYGMIHTPNTTVEIDDKTWMATDQYDESGKLLYVDEQGEARTLKSGGKVEDSKLDDINETPNVIPEGNLHARLHHMEGAESLTKKGIPVVDKDGNLLAEIELNEIIFNYEVTKKLEELHDKYKEENDDKYAIEAGKMIAQQVMENTEDRTGLIQEIV